MPEREKDKVLKYEHLPIASILELQANEFTGFKTSIDDLIMEDPEHFSPQNLATGDSLRLKESAYSAIKEVIPVRLRESLIEFGASPKKETLLISGLPLDDLLKVRTPDNGGISADKRTAMSELELLSTMLATGCYPIAYVDEKDGTLIHTIAPTQAGQTRQENTGSGVLLEAHTEDAVHPYKPEIISLICLRSNENAWTGIMSMTEAWNFIPEKQRDEVNKTLRQPYYTIGLPSSYTGKDDLSQYSPVMPVLSGPEDNPEMNVDLHAMRIIKESPPEAREHLMYWHDALKKTMKAHVLKAGDLLLIKNSKVAHWRTSFPAQFDGNDRYLQRLFRISQPAYNESASYRNGHVFHQLSSIYQDRGMKPIQAEQTELLIAS